MMHAKRSPERLTLFSDGVFAVLITVLVLELRPPELPTFADLLSHWPTWLSYAVSYVFIAIVWANHHHLMHYATEATSRLMWFNFAHLFSVSLLPLSTAWMAVSRLAAPQKFLKHDEINRWRLLARIATFFRSTWACPIAGANCAKAVHLDL
jgi:uncharacterized membrane protein